MLEGVDCQVRHHSVPRIMVVHIIVPGGGQAVAVQGQAVAGGGGAGSSGWFKGQAVAGGLRGSLQRVVLGQAGWQAPRSRAHPLPSSPLHVYLKLRPLPKSMSWLNAGLFLVTARR